MLKNENDVIKGRIINIASIAGIVGFAASPAYCASKGGLILLTKEMALDYASHINIMFLASPDADFITGASLVVDGGWTVK